jgi:hypothetical protein
MSRAIRVSTSNTVLSTRTHKAVAGTAMAAAVTVSSALALASPAAAGVVQKRRGLPPALHPKVFSQGICRSYDDRARVREIHRCCCGGCGFGC